MTAMMDTAASEGKFTGENYSIARRDCQEKPDPAGFLRKPEGCLHTDRLTYKSLRGYSKSIRDEKARRALSDCAQCVHNYLTII